ncbi:MAG: DUF5977 domain-containing protein, partial [Chitinophagaceae bacterium]
IGNNWATYNYMERIVDTRDPVGYDSEPDLFNFNFDGYSGSFVFDDYMNIVQIAPSNLQIYFDQYGVYWNFKVITPNGITYYFGGNDATEKTKRDQICSRTYDNFIETSWYLKKIEHLNGDAIFFTYIQLDYSYDNGLSETMYWTSPTPPDGGPLGDNCATIIGINPPNTSCINLSTTKGVLLDQILAPGNQLIKFQYILRSDCKDMLISKITQTNLAAGSLGTTNIWNFIYNTITSANYNGKLNFGVNKTPYLIDLIQRNADSSIFLKHSFVYNDALARPPRLSYAQDHWGFFNGKNNTTLIPTPETIEDQVKFIHANANREPDFKYAVKGMLSKIMYPTGGIDSVVYELNQQLIPVPQGNMHELFIKVTGIGDMTEKIDTLSFNINSIQDIKIEINCIDNSGIGDFDSLHNIGTLQIVNPIGQVEYSKMAINPGEKIIENFRPTIQGKYKATIKAKGSVVTTKATINFVPNFRAPLESINIGGLRVKAVFTTPSKNDIPILKRYFYGSLNSLDKSSLANLSFPVYKKNYDTRVSCGHYFQLDSFHTIIMPDSYAYHHHIAMYSNSIVTLFSFEIPVSYATIVESNGVLFEGGVTETQFFASGGSGGTVLWGNGVLGSPLSNSTNLFNGKLKEVTSFKYDNNQNYIPLKKEINTYKIDKRNSTSVFGYRINQKYENVIFPSDSSCTVAVPADQICRAALSMCLDAFDMTRYEYTSKWIYQDSSTEITYDQNGLNPVLQSSVYYYDDSVNLQLSKTDTYDSKGNLKRTVFKYPNDYTNIDVYNDMQNKNISSPVIDVQTFTNKIKNIELNTNYKKWSNSNYLPDTIYKGILANPLEIEGAITKYDKAGNILEFKGRNGVLTSIIYGYNNLFPIAKIVGASYNQAKNKMSVDTSVINIYGSDELLPEINKIRTNLPNAFVTTYTYQNLVGVTSITDENNKTTFYDYDELNRLKTIRDFENNYLKKLDYSYNQPDLSQKVKAWFNPLMSQTFYCQSCLTGYSPVSFVYSIPVGKYFSTISQADANSKAQADIDTNGQNNANANGTCTLKCTNCIGENKKCVNELCETGVKHIVGVVQVNEGGPWVCTYYWIWSDGSSSDLYSTTSPDFCDVQ